MRWFLVRLRRLLGVRVMTTADIDKRFESWWSSVPFAVRASGCREQYRLAYFEGALAQLELSLASLRGGR